MADSQSRNGSAGRHLDATGPREVIYCHQCENEWYQDDHGLICPRCEGEIIEIVDPASDPRPGMHRAPSAGVSPLRDLHNHDPWGGIDDSDPEEADIEEHITHGPGGSIFITHTIRSTGPFNNRRRRNPGPDGGEDEILRDFHSMLGNLMGPNLRGGPPGRSGPDTLFPGGSGGFRFGGGGVGGGPGPAVAHGRVTYSGRFENGRFRRNDDDPAQQADPPSGDIATLLTSLFSQMAPGSGEGEARRPGLGAAGLPGILASLLNPANAVHGDAVYSQEALDRIMSQLMEQHQSSNAPGPAPPDAISALPKKKLDEKMLGPEGKGECSVCMDDVHFDDEVVVLPCNHWFHEACASAWLSEHNTCPICRKGIGSEEPSSSSSASRRSSQSAATNANLSRNDHRNRRLSNPRPSPRIARSESERNARNEARLNAIRFGSNVPPPASRSASFQGAFADAPFGNTDNSSSSSQTTPRPMPGEFPSSTPPARDRDSVVSGMSNQRDTQRSFPSGSGRESSSSHRPRSSRSDSDNENGNGHGGAFGWIRDRWGRRSDNV